MNLLAVRRFEIPLAVTQSCVDVMQGNGRRGAETFLAFAGELEAQGQKFAVRRALIPQQTARRTRQGLLVTIDGDALFQLNLSCFEHGELLGGQIHSHPDKAYHSRADDELALVRMLGGISVVVPSFARAGLAGIDGWSFHQLNAQGAWGPLPPRVEVGIT